MSFISLAYYYHGRSARSLFGGLYCLGILYAVCFSAAALSSELTRARAKFPLAIGLAFLLRSVELNSDPPPNLSKTGTYSNSVDKLCG